MRSSPEVRPISQPVVYFTLQNGGRRTVSFTPEHRDHFSDLVSATLASCPSVRVHAFSWTASEIRIVLEGGEPARRRFARELCSMHRETMHEEICGRDCLFERVYKETRVETDRDLLDVAEHVHDAPVRAGLARRASDYPWSSCGAYLGITWVPWLTTELIVAVARAPRGNPGRGLPNRASVSELPAAYHRQS